MRTSTFSSLTGSTRRTPLAASAAVVSIYLEVNATIAVFAPIRTLCTTVSFATDVTHGAIDFALSTVGVVLAQINAFSIATTLCQSTFVATSSTILSIGTNGNTEVAVATSVFGGIVGTTTCSTEFVTRRTVSFADTLLAFFLGFALAGAVSTIASIC